MKYNFNTEMMEVEGHTFWVAKSLVLKGCVGQGDTVEEAIAELEDNELEWLDSAKKYNIPIPAPAIKTEKSFSGKLSLRMSPFIHEKASNQADFLGISLNQYITDAIAHYNSVIDSNYTKSVITSSQTESRSQLTQEYHNHNKVIKIRFNETDVEEL